MKYNTSQSIQKKITIAILGFVSLAAIASAGFYSTTTSTYASEASNRRANYVRNVAPRQNVVIQSSPRNITTNVNSDNSCVIRGNNQSCTNGVITQNPVR
jgi:hypothetical protein